jgi:signal transduction histidine kinase
MGTEDGLLCFDKGKFVKFTKSNGLEFENIYRILEDNQGFLWLSGNFGLQRISLDDLKRLKKEGTKASIPVMLFNTRHGMLNAETNGGIFPAGWKMKDGSLWFPTVEGIAIVEPGLIMTKERSLRTHIGFLRYGGKDFFPENGIKIPASVNSFEIDYSSIDFTNAQPIHYYYRLKGLNDEWQFADHRRTAYFTSLSPGTYVFEVKAKQFGKWSGTETLEFTVLPLFYQTAWFKIMLALIFIGLVLLFIWLQKRTADRKILEQKKLSKAQIKGQEKEKQFIGAELHDNINQQLTTAKLYLDLARVNEEMRMDLIEKSGMVVSKAINEIRALSKSLIPPTIKDIGLIESLQEIVDSYSLVQKFKIIFKSTEVLNELDEDLKLSIYRIVQEHMNNIVKYSEADNVWIRFDETQGQVLLSIRDDGKGFDVKNTIRSKGVGLLNMKNRLELYNGTFEIDSAPARGCTLRISIPLKYAEI